MYLKYSECTSKYRKLLGKMDDYLSQLGRKSLAFTYGSVPFNEHTQSSDIDVLVFFDRSDEATVLDFVNFWKEKCLEAGIDDGGEVPRKKLLGGTFDTLYAAIELEPFRSEAGVVMIPDILDTKEYYESEVLLQRLAFNAMTMKNFFVHGEEDEFQRLKVIAQNNLAFLLFKLSYGQIRDAEDYVDSMIYEWKGIRKEGLYLGYKDWKELRIYFVKIFQNIINENCLEPPQFRLIPEQLKI